MAIQKNSKINFYKFVQVKVPNVSAKMKGELKPIITNTVAINNLGATVNSIARIARDFKKIQLQKLVLSRKSLKNFEANYTKTQKKKEFSGFSPAALIKKPNWLEGLFKMLSGLIKAAIVIPALQWLSKEENREKISNMIEALSKLATFIFKVSSFGVVNTIEGLYDLFSDQTSPWEKVGGLVRGLTGLGTLLLGLRWLSNPTRIITDFGNVLIFLNNNLIRGRRGLIGRAGALGLIAATAYGGYKLYEYMKEDGSGGGTDPNDDGSETAGLTQAEIDLGERGNASFDSDGNFKGDITLGKNVNITINSNDAGDDKSKGNWFTNLFKSNGGLLPSFAQGGWISGPQSGYGVSLDGGNSTSFIGHGTEYVARKSNGGAFVVPFDTPGTRSQPNLTDKRLGEAKSMGFDLGGFSKGGKIPEMFMGGAMGIAQQWWKNLTGGGGKPTKPTTSEPVSKRGQDQQPTIGAGLQAVTAGGKWALDKGFTVAEHPNFRKNNYSGSGPNRGVGYNKRGGERVGGHSDGSLHYKGLALDITDWRPGAWKARTAQLAEQAYQLRDKMKLSQIISDGWGQWFKGGGKSGPGSLGHPEHLHLGFLEGISKGLQGGSSSSTANMPTAAGGYGAILDLIGKRESDSVGGYNAVNQGGADGGHTALGYSGDYRKAPFNQSGKSLTSMTVQEIMDKQYDDGKMSDSQWKSGGKLHAVGRYQFIGSTLRSLVEQGVVSPNDQFSPATQNKLGIALVKQTGGSVSRLKSTWIGLQHESDSAVSSAMAAGGAATNRGYSSGSGNMSAKKRKDKEGSPQVQRSLANIFGKSSSSTGMTLDGRRGGSSPTSQFQEVRRQKKLENQTKERNNARRQVTERSQEMIKQVMSAVAAQNGVNSQAIQAAHVALASVAGQAGGQPQMMSSGSSSGPGSIASTLQSTLNPLRGLLR